MIALETIAVAFAMFSAIPVPQPVWGKRNMRFALCAFPLIGVVCAVCWCAWAVLCTYLNVPDLLRAAVLTLLPILITGGIHLDGYADTCDALSSYGEPAKKQEILKDPHCGAFAVIRLCTYFLAYFALCSAVQLNATALLGMGFTFVLERALSGWAVAALPMAKNTGLAHTFAEAADKIRVRRILACVSAGLCVCLALFCGVTGFLMSVTALLVMWRYRCVAAAQFGGISGDLAGWFLQKAEFWMLAVLVALQIIGGCL